jgi:hypothetical protein
MKTITSTLLATLFLLSAPLFAGVTVVTISKSNGCDDHTSDGKTTMYLRPDIMRIDVEDKDRKTGIIFQKSSEKMWVIDYEDKSYHTISKEEFAAYKKQFEEVHKMMEEQLKNLPEDQREHVKKMMAQRSVVMQEKPEVTYVKTGEKEQVKNWSTEKYNYKEDDKLVAHYWVVDEAALDVDQKDVQIVHDFSAFISENFDMFSFGASTATFSPNQTFEGFPVKTVRLEKGKPCVVSTVESITTGSLENSLFEIPKGYSKKENPLKEKR